MAFIWNSPFKGILAFVCVCVAFIYVLMYCKSHVVLSICSEQPSDINHGKQRIHVQIFVIFSKLGCIKAQLCFEGRKRFCFILVISSICVNKAFLYFTNLKPINLINLTCDSKLNSERWQAFAAVLLNFGTPHGLSKKLDIIYECVTFSRCPSGLDSLIPAVPWGPKGFAANQHTA